MAADQVPERGPIAVADARENRLVFHVPLPDGVMAPSGLYRHAGQRFPRGTRIGTVAAAEAEGEWRCVSPAARLMLRQPNDCSSPTCGEDATAFARRIARRTSAREGDR